MKDPIHRYLIRLYWSDDDEGYVAEVPALPGCIAVGETTQKAVREIAIAMKLWLATAKKHGDPIPEPDLAREEIQRLAPFLNLSKLARRAGLNNHTLASKLRRKSPFNPKRGQSHSQGAHAGLKTGARDRSPKAIGKPAKCIYSAAASR